MSREHPLFRSYLERLDEKFPNTQEYLSVKEVGEFCGRGKTYVYKKFGNIIDCGKISKTKLAYALCQN